jgi:hypothetical protein
LQVPIKLYNFGYICCDASGQHFPENRDVRNNAWALTKYSTTRYENMEEKMRIKVHHDEIMNIKFSTIGGTRMFQTLKMVTTESSAFSILQC